MDGQKILIKQEMKRSNLKLLNNTFIVSGTLPNPDFEELKTLFNGEQLTADEFSLTLNKGSLDNFFAHWKLSNKIDQELHSLKEVQKIQSKFSL